MTTQARESFKHLHHVLHHASQRPHLYPITDAISSHTLTLSLRFFNKAIFRYSKLAITWADAMLDRIICEFSKTNDAASIALCASPSFILRFLLNWGTLWYSSVKVRAISDLLQLQISSRVRACHRKQKQLTRFQHPYRSKWCKTPNIGWKRDNSRVVQVESERREFSRNISLCIILYFNILL